MLESSLLMLSCSDRIIALIMTLLMSCNFCNTSNSPSGPHFTQMASVFKQRSHQLTLAAKKVFIFLVLRM